MDLIQVKKELCNRMTMDRRAMSALGRKQTLNRVHPMSAIPPKADIDRYASHVRFVPIADIGR